MKPIDILLPPFIYKRAVYAAIFIILLLIVACIFMMSSSEKTFRDINHDGNIDWNELYVAWKLPGTTHWWKYIFGIVFVSWAVFVGKRVHDYDKKINMYTECITPETPPPNNS